MLLHENHDWSQPITEGPSRLGFDTSYVSIQGIQRPPYVFFRNEYLDVPDVQNLTESVKYWLPGNYYLPGGISKIIAQGGQGK